MAESSRKDMESWTNTTRSAVVISRLDHRGEMTRQELVTGGKTFHLTPEERRINQEAVADSANDMFKNGFLRPVRLIEDNEEARELASNPNTMSESDMETLLKGHHKTFVAKLKEIRNPVTLDRMMKTAIDCDASISRIESIKERLAEIAPNLYTEVTSSAVSGGQTAPAPESARKGVTPR